MSDYIITGGILIMSHESFLIFFKSISKFSKKDPEFVKECRNRLISVDAIFIDEAHKIKNDKSQLYEACCEIKTPVRVCITGTPLQNNLLEFYTMCSFVNPRKWDKIFFREFYTNPINAGRDKEALPSDVKLMQRRCFMLTKEMETFVNRKTQSVLKKDLPEKKEYIIKIEMTKLQKNLYKSYLNFLESNGKSKEIGVLGMVSVLGKISNHPDLFKKYISEQIEKLRLKRLNLDKPPPKQSSNNDDADDSVGLKRKKKRKSDTQSRKHSKLDIKSPNQKSLDVYIKKSMDDLDDDVAETEMYVREMVDVEETDKKLESIVPLDGIHRIPIPIPMITPINQNTINLMKQLENDRIESTKRQLSTYIERLESWMEKNIPKDYIENDIENSPKMKILYEIIQEKYKKNEKIIIFSQFTQTLDMIESIFSKNPIIKRKQKTLLRKDYDYVRLDGSDSLKDRKISLNSFSTSKDIDLFLISTRAGGIGINLVEANNPIMFDVSWNPANDQQAIFRTYRYGQTKNVFVYRFISFGTPEDSIWNKCIDKTWLFNKVVDDQTPKRMLNKEDTTILKQKNGKYIYHGDEDYEFDNLEEIDSSLKTGKLDLKNLINCDIKPEALEDSKNKREALLEEFKEDSSIIELLNSQSSIHIKTIENHESLFLHDEGDIISEEEKIIALNELNNKSTQIVVNRTIVPSNPTIVPSIEEYADTLVNLSKVSESLFNQNQGETNQQTLKVNNNNNNKELQNLFLTLKDMVTKKQQNPKHQTTIYKKISPVVISSDSSQ